MKWQGARRGMLILVAVGVATRPGALLAQPAAADPPARVGRLARIVGTVSYHLAQADRWEPAVLNLPVTTGTAIWTEPGARAELGIAGDRLVLDQSTELDITQLDDRMEAASLPQGAMFWQLHGLPAGNVAGVQTPRGQVLLASVGRYEVVAGDTAHPTTVTVIEGEANLTGPGVDLHVGPNQTATIVGDATAPFQATVGPAVRDPFLTAILAEERPARRPAVPPPAYVAQMTGGAALDEYGDWASTPEYPAIWYPPAQPGFVPYRAGHWAFVQPWGWTWVDDAPWGFAPSHYGRWVQVSDRWGWIPGLPAAPVLTYPVYAPAVVGFLGGAAVGVLAGRVGWVPLGPREPYIPPYRVSNTYVRNVNVTNITNTTNIYARPGTRQPPLSNGAAATLVPATAMTGSRNLVGLSQPLPPGAMRPGAALLGRPPVSPTAATLGITPPLARQLNLPAGEGARPAGPGPAIRTMAPRPFAAPPGAVPGLRTPGAGRPDPASMGAPPRPLPAPMPGPGPAPQPVPRPDVARPEPARPDLARPAPPRPEAARPYVAPRPEPGPARQTFDSRPDMRPAPPPEPRRPARPSYEAPVARPAPPPMRVPQPQFQPPPRMQPPSPPAMQPRPEPQPRPAPPPQRERPREHRPGEPR